MNSRRKLAKPVSSSMHASHGSALRGIVYIHVCTCTSKISVLKSYSIKEFATALCLQCAYLLNRHIYEWVYEYEYLLAAVLRIRIRMFLGLPDPDPFKQRYGPGSRSFYNQTKIVRKTLIPTVL